MGLLTEAQCLLTGLSAVALCVGLYFIKHKNWRAHRASMLTAFGFSSLFLVSYVVNHALGGDTPFPGIGTAYLSILASHILFSIVALPMVLTTLFFALSGRFRIRRPGGQPAPVRRRRPLHGPARESVSLRASAR
jgi:putative membrane protein